MHPAGTKIASTTPPETVCGMVMAFDKHHEPNPSIRQLAGAGTKVRHSEYFSGVHVLFLNKTLARTEEGLAALNRALRQRAGAAAGVRRGE